MDLALFFSQQEHNARQDKNSSFVGGEPEVEEAFVFSRSTTSGGAAVSAARHLPNVQPLGLLYLPRVECSNSAEIQFPRSSLPTFYAGRDMRTALVRTKDQGPLQT